MELVVATDSKSVAVRHVGSSPTAGTKEDRIMLYYILIESWAVYVKEGEFFKSQGGLEKKWGENWVPVQADSIEHARSIGINRRDTKIV